MAVHTILHVATSGIRKQGVDEVLVTRNASALSHPAIAWFDLNRVLESPRGECQGVKETVVRFGDPFADKVMWQVAVIANRDVVMTTLLPRIHVILHHMTIHAGLRVVAQIAGTLAVAEREHSKT